MPVDKLLEILVSPNALERREQVIEILGELGLSEGDPEKLSKRLLGLNLIFPSSAAVKAFARSYLRICSKGINKDGRDSSVIIEITKRCNKNCLHCYSRKLTDRQDMDDDILERIINLVRYNYKHVFLTGGNPVVDKRIFRLAQDNPDIVFFMFNNGSGIDEENSKLMAEVGNIIPLIGIDGSAKEEHERFRGEGSYDEVENTCSILNKFNVPWGYISLVTEINAKDVLSAKFVRDVKARGAIIGRYIEYLPVGPEAKKEFILSGESYYLLEKRKKEIIENHEIYMQETAQSKCLGLLFFDVDGNIKNCPFMHYSKYNVACGSIIDNIEETISDWSSAPYNGECPIYSNPVGFKDHLLSKGWKNLSPFVEEYLINSEIYEYISANYHKYLELKKERGI